MKKIVEYLGMVLVGLPNIIALGSGYWTSFMPALLKVFEFAVYGIDVFIHTDQFFYTFNNFLLSVQIEFLTLLSFLIKSSFVFFVFANYLIEFIFIVGFKIEINFVPTFINKSFFFSCISTLNFELKALVIS